MFRRTTQPTQAPSPGTRRVARMAGHHRAATGAGADNSAAVQGRAASHTERTQRRLFGR
jgi:hypothetical protein